VTLPSAEPDWADGVESLRRRTAVTAALVNADLLEGAESRWRGQVIPRTSMHDLLFTRPGDEYPFERSVRVAFNPDDETFAFTLMSQAGPVTGDVTRPETAPAVLDAFLMQLVGQTSDPAQAS
jgi:hypothetical protein